ncbi:histone-lysine N-methyltransferase SETMAR [Trichonephila clavipes]|nr:histone-lysine N-methyltransferase SETMAR [Trichonephila clavipes]
MQNRHPETMTSRKGLSPGEMAYFLREPFESNEHLQQIGKTNRAGVWVPYNMSEENKANRSTTCTTYCFKVQYRAVLIMIAAVADEKWVCMIIKTQNTVALSEEPPRRTTRPKGLHPKALLCVWWGIRCNRPF